MLKQVKEHWPGVTLLAAFVLVVFWPYLLGLRYLAGGDLVDSFLPLKTFLIHSLQEGEFPLWNPRTFCGNPFTSNIQATPFYPLDLLLLLMPIPLYYNWCAAVQIFLCGLSVYCLAWESFKSRLGAAMSGLVFAGCAHVIGRIYMGHVNHWTTYPWMVFALFFFERWLKSGRPLAWAGMTGALALQYLGGHPQIPLFSGYLLIAYGITRMIQLIRGGAPAGRIVKKLGGLPAGVFLAVLIASVTLLPFGEAVFYTASRAGGASYDFVTTDSMPLTHTWTLLFPFIFGTPAQFGQDNTYWETGTAYHEIAGYIGVAPLILAFCSLFIRQPAWKMKRFWWIVAIICLFFAYGRFNPAYYLIYKFIPGFSFVRVPGRLLLIYSLALSLLAGWTLSTGWAKVKSKIYWLGPLAFIVLIGSLLLFSVIFHDSLIDILQSMRIHYLTANGLTLQNAMAAVPRDYAVVWSSLWIQALWMALGWSALLCLLLLAGRRIGFRYAGMAILLTVFLDLAIYSFHEPMGYASQDYYKRVYPHGSVVQFLEEQTRADPAVRFMNLDDTLAWNLKHLAPDFIAQRWLSYSISGVRGCDPMILSHYSEFINVMQGRPPEEHPRSLLFIPTYEGCRPEMRKLLSARFIVTRDRLPGLKLRHQDGTGLNVYEDPSALPRAFFCRDTEDLTNIHPAQITRLARNQVVIEVEAPEDGWLVLLDVHYPGWKVSVDDTDVEYEPFGPFRKVRLNKGTHQLVWRYHPKIFFYSLALSALSLVFLIQWAFRHRRNEPIIPG